MGRRVVFNWILSGPLIFLLQILIVIFNWRLILNFIIVKLIDDAIPIIFLDFLGEDNFMFIIQIYEMFPELIPYMFFLKVLFAILILYLLHLVVKILQLLPYLLYLLFDRIKFLLLLILLRLVVVGKVVD